MQIHHHGAVDGVTGSCHELRLDDDSGLLIDCGLFQGAETSPAGKDAQHLEIEFPVEHLRALVVTHVHIDHVGRIPYLLAAGFGGPILCSQPSAVLLPLVLEDALRIGFTRNEQLIKRVLKRVRQRIVAVPYQQWQPVEPSARQVSRATPLAVRLKPAGHILGSAYVECRVGRARRAPIALFSGDLGAPWTPLLPAPRPAWRADVVVLESTYGDRCHPADASSAPSSPSDSRR